jgi:CheY-like chemotaxis protein
VLIDDDRASLELLTAYLEGLAVRVVRAHDAAEGLAAVRQLTPAAVVLDIRLPGMDGWEVLRQIRAEQTTRDLPVVVVSILDEKARGLALGADAYLIKPVAKDDLVRALQTAGVLPAPAASPVSLDRSAGDLPAARRPDR